MRTRLNPDTGCQLFIDYGLLVRETTSIEFRMIHPGLQSGVDGKVSPRWSADELLAAGPIDFRTSSGEDITLLGNNTAFSPRGSTGNNTARSATSSPFLLPVADGTVSQPRV